MRFVPMTRESALAQIGKEHDLAKRARDAGNDGMVRVCARRAAGIAITYSLQAHPGTDRGNDAMSKLYQLRRDTSRPQAVRDAASRLTARVTAEFTSPYSTDPMDDAMIIISHFMDENQQKGN
jgi:hypothetical protein